MLYFWHRRLGVALFDTFWEQRPSSDRGGCPCRYCVPPQKLKRILGLYNHNSLYTGGSPATLPPT